CGTPPRLHRWPRGASGRRSSGNARRSEARRHPGTTPRPRVRAGRGRRQGVWKSSRSWSCTREGRGSGAGTVQGPRRRLVQEAVGWKFTSIDSPRPRKFRPRREILPVEHHRSEEHTSELQSRENLVCRLLLEKKKKRKHHA